MKRYVFLSIFILIITSLIVAGLGESFYSDGEGESELIEGNMNTDVFEITNSNKAEIWGENYADKTEITKVIVKTEEVPDKAFFGWTALKEVTFSDEVITIGDNIFGKPASIDMGMGDIFFDEWGDMGMGDYDPMYEPYVHFPNRALDVITFGTGLTSVGDGAFSVCMGLKTLDFSMCTNLNTFGSKVFAITPLTEIKFGGTFEEMPNLSGLNKLEKVDFSRTTNINQIPDKAFDKTLITDLDLSATKITSVNKWFTKNANFINITLPDTVNAIEEGAFKDVKSLKEINIPDSIKIINKDAFFGCLDLDTITFGSQPLLKTIKENAFGNTGLKTFTIPDSVVDICYGALAIDGVTNFEIPESIKTMNDPFGQKVGKNLTFKGVYGTTLEEVPIFRFGGVQSFTVPESDFESKYSKIMMWNLYNDVQVNKAVMSVINTNGDSINSLVKESTLILYVGSGSEYTIPGEITKIGPSAFASSNITKITFSEGLTEIGNNAFDGLNLGVINLPASLTTIAESAFNASGLTEVTFSTESQLINIGDNAFYGNGNMTKFVMPGSVTTIGSKAFYNCGALSVVNVSSAVTTIGESAFLKTGITSLNLPNSLTEIGKDAFQGCFDLKTVSIGTGLKNITVGMFKACYSLESISIPGNVEVIEDSAFERCNSLKTVTLSEGLKTIGKDAFKSCQSITTLTIPASVTNMEITVLESQGRIIWAHPFDGCIDLAEINIESNNTTYKSENNLILSNDGTVLYYSPEGLSEIIIPESVTSIHSDWVKEGNVPMEEGDTVENWISTKKAEKGEKVLSVESYAENNKTFLKYEYQYPIFQNHINAKKVTFQSSIPVGYRMFEGCIDLKEVILCENITEIGSYAFSDTPLMKLITADLGENIKLPDHLVRIGDYAFSGCFNLSGTFDFNNVTTLGNYVLRNTNVETVVIGSSMNTMEDNVFDECYSLATISSENTRYNVKNNVLYDGTVLFKVPGALSGVVTIDSTTTDVRTGAALDSFEISEYVMSDGESVFTVENKCLIKSSTLYLAPSNVSVVTIPSTVSAVKTHAFSGYIEEITFDGGSISFEKNSIQGLNNLHTISIKSSETITLADLSIRDCTHMLLLNLDGKKIKSTGNSVHICGTSDSTIILKETDEETGIANTIVNGMTAKVLVVEGSMVITQKPKELEIYCSNVDVSTTLELGNVMKYSNGTWTGVGTYKIGDDLEVILFDKVSKIVVDSIIGGISVEFIGEKSIKLTSSIGLTHHDIIVKDGSTVLTVGDGFTYTSSSTDEIIKISIEERVSSTLHTISFDSKGGCDVPSFYVSDGRTILPAQLEMVPVKDKHTFDGWYINESCESKYVYGTPISEDTTFYAKWTENANPRIYLEEFPGAVLVKNGDTVITKYFTSGTNLTLSYDSAPGFEFISWSFEISDAKTESTERVVTLSNVTADVYISVNLRYVSESSVVTPETIVESIKPGDDITLLWRVDTEVDMGHNTWQMPSSPLIVENVVYIRCNGVLYGYDVDTGQQKYKATESERSQSFYHNLAYGDGKIIDIFTKSVYDLELKKIGTMSKEYSGIFYDTDNGYFYGTSEGLVYCFTLGENGVETMRNGYTAPNSNWYGMYGIASAPVFKDGYVYFIETDGRDRIVSSISPTGVKKSVTLDEIEGHNLDDGWLTTNGTHLFLTTYTVGLFGSIVADGPGQIVTIKIEDEGALSVTEYNSTGNGNASSALVTFNGRGYLNNGKEFVVFNLSKLTDGKTTGRNCEPKIYSESSVYSHGSIVVNTSYATNENGYEVYVYLLGYHSRDQAIHVFTDNQNKKSADEMFVTTPAGPGNYCSQAVRVGPEGQLVWYTDTGSLFCYSSAEDNPYYFLIDKGDEAVWVSSVGSNPYDALSNVSEVELTKFGTISEVMGVDSSTIEWKFYYPGGSGWTSSTHIRDDSFDANRFWVITSQQSFDDSQKWLYVNDSGVVKQRTIADMISDKSTQVIEYGKDVLVEIQRNGTKTTFMIATNLDDDAQISLELKVMFDNNTFMRSATTLDKSDDIACQKIQIQNAVMPSEYLVSIYDSDSWYSSGAEALKKITETLVEV